MLSCAKEDYYETGRDKPYFRKNMPKQNHEEIKRFIIASIATSLGTQVVLINNEDVQEVFETLCSIPFEQQTPVIESMIEQLKTRTEYRQHY